jgi:hypothetical protein
VREGWLFVAALEQAAHASSRMASSDGEHEEFDDDWEEWDPHQSSFLTHTIAGSCAGVMEHVGMFPVDTYKVRPLLAFSRIAASPIAVHSPQYCFCIRFIRYSLLLLLTDGVIRAESVRVPTKTCPATALQSQHRMRRF